jgi:hypothetical protein
LHGVDQGDDVVLLDVEVLDGALEEFFFGRHGFIRISTFGAGLARVLCEFNKGLSEGTFGVRLSGDVHLLLRARLFVTDLNSRSDFAIVRSSRNGEFQAGLSQGRHESVRRVSACCAIEGVDIAQGRNSK